MNDAMEAPVPGKALNSTVIDAEYGYVIAPMKQGLRLTVQDFAR